MPPTGAITDLLSSLVSGQTLSERAAEEAFAVALSGEADEAQFAALLALIQQRGVTADELTGAARVMRRLVTPVPVDDALRPRLVDTCGTGGAPKTFNVSTAAALIAAGVGLMHADDAGPALAVAKHGNRSRTGRGSAEVLQSLGVNIDASPDTQARCLSEAAVCFCFAIRHHPAMVHAAGPRKSLGFPTIFNLLGPLTNPAGATRQLLGVYDARFLPLIAEALARLGSEHAMVAHGNDGLDELTTTTTSRLATVNDGATDETTMDPRSLGLSPATLDDLRVVDSPDESAALIEAILAGKAGPPADIALLNAAAAVVVGGLADDLAGGLERARAAVAGGGAADALHRLRKASNA